MSTPEALGLSQHKSARLSDALWRAAMLTLALLPLGMAIAHRSSPAFLGLATAFVLGAIHVEGRWTWFAGEALRRLRRALGILCVSFLVWCMLSVSWSEFPVTSLRAFGEFMLSVAFSFILAVTLPQRMTRTAFLLVIGSCIAAIVLMLIELYGGMAIRRSLDVRADSFIYNRPTLTLMLLLPILVVWLSLQKRIGWIVAGIVAVLVVAMVIRSDSGAAVVGLVVTMVILAVAYFSPRRVAWAGAIGFVVVMASAPFLGAIGNAVISKEMHTKLAAAHSRDRIKIWRSFNAVTQQDPVLGEGFGISPVMDKTSVAAEVPRRFRTLLGVGHPHNAAIQIWVELGIVGAVLTLGIALLTLRAIARQPRRFAAASLALMAGAAIVALIGHGAWQGWWAASIGAAIVWLLSAKAENARVENGR